MEWFACGKQCEFYHVDCDQVKDKFCFNSSGGGGILSHGQAVMW